MLSLFERPDAKANPIRHLSRTWLIDLRGFRKNTVTASIGPDGSYIIMDYIQV